MKPSEQKKKRG